MHHSPGARRLPEIVADLHPWLRTRIAAIRIARTPAQRWEAVLSYVPRTLPPPPEVGLAPAEASEPRDTHHALALPSAGTEAALRAQLRDLADIPELGTLQVENLRAAPDGPPAESSVWRIVTHAGLVHQRRAWLARIGRRDFDR
jgi:hypothetical protein